MAKKKIAIDQHEWYPVYYEDEYLGSHPSYVMVDEEFWDRYTKARDEFEALRDEIDEHMEYLPEPEEEPRYVFVFTESTVPDPSRVSYSVNAEGKVHKYHMDMWGRLIEDVE